MRGGERAEGAEKDEAHNLRVIRQAPRQDRVRVVLRGVLDAHGRHGHEHDRGEDEPNRAEAGGNEGCRHRRRDEREGVLGGEKVCDDSHLKPGQKRLEEDAEGDQHQGPVRSREGRDDPGDGLGKRGDPRGGRTRAARRGHRG